MTWLRQGLLRLLPAAACLAALAAPSALAQDDAIASVRVEEAFGLLGLDSPEGSTEDPARIARGLALLEDAAEAGDAMALNTLGVLHANGAFGLEPDAERALALYEAAMASGEERPALTASLNWAVLQLDTDEAARAAALLERVYASDTDVAPLAAAHLARAYAFGLGVEADLPRAGDLYEEAVAVDPGDVLAHYMLARGYESGWFDAGVQPKRALAHFQIAADLGEPRSAWKIGIAHLQGRGGFARDSQEAYAWFVRASEGGAIDGMISRAVMLATGDGVAQDPEAAAYWYGEAAALGSAHAMRGLGAMHVFGELEPANRAMGWALLELAAEGGDENAVAILEQVAPRFDEDERRRVDLHKAEWRLRAQP